MDPHHTRCRPPMVAVNRLALNRSLYHYHLRMRSSAGALLRAMYLLHTMGAYSMTPSDASCIQQHHTTAPIQGTRFRLA